MGRLEFAVGVTTATKLNPFGHLDCIVDYVDDLRCAPLEGKK